MTKDVSMLEVVSSGVPVPVDETSSGVPLPVEPEPLACVVALPTWVHGEWSTVASAIGKRALRFDAVAAVVPEASPKRVSGVMSIAGLPVDAVRMLPDLEHGSESRA